MKHSCNKIKPPPRPHAKAAEGVGPQGTRAQADIKNRPKSCLRIWTGLFLFYLIESIYSVEGSDTIFGISCLITWTRSSMTFIYWMTFCI